MSKKLVVFNPAFPAAIRKTIAERAEHYGYTAVFCDHREDALRELSDAEIALAYGAEYLKAGKQLKWFCTSSAGVDAYCAPGVIENEDLILSNSTGAYGVTLAEHTLMTTLAVLRRFPLYTKSAEAHQWISAGRQPHIRGIYGSRVTVLGTGNLGSEIAARLRPFAPKNIVGVNRSGHDCAPLFDRSVPMGKLHDVLPETDILIMALPGTGETYHCISSQELALLPEGAVVNNVGRGNALDIEALAESLRSGHLFGTAVDVFETEPVPSESELWECPGLLITPHCAGNNTLSHTVERISELFLEDFENYCSGRPLRRRIDVKRGY